MRRLPHNSAHFTQGLVYEGKRLFESAGGYGSSALHEKDLESGRSLKSQALPADVFAEGLTALNGELIQLSWRNRKGFVYDKALRELRRFSYAGEGWGLATDGTALVMSDGSSVLRWLDPEQFQVKRRISVKHRGQPLRLLNELEFARGHLYANVWMSDRIAVIAPADGTVLAWLDLSALKKSMPKPAGWDEREHVLNGIAFDADRGHFYVTGKCWPELFELKLEPIGK